MGGTGACLLVGTAVLRGVFRGSCGLSQTLSSLSDGWWVGLYTCPLGCLASGVPALEPSGCWVGPGLGVKMVVSRTAHTTTYYLESPPPLPLSPQWATATPNHPRRLSKAIRLVWPRLLWSKCFVPGSWCTWDLVCTLQEWHFCFPHSCGVPKIKPHWPSEPNALGAPPHNARAPNWGAWHGAQNAHSCGRTSVI